MKHRLFFALMPPPAVWSAIGVHAHAYAERRVANERLHMTLAVTEQRQAFSHLERSRLCALGAEIAVQPIPVSLERISSLGRVLMLAPACVAPALRELQDRVKTGMARRGLLMEKKTFHPHVTLTIAMKDSPSPARSRRSPGRPANSC